MEFIQNKFYVIEGKSLNLLVNSFESINEGGEEIYNGKTHNYKHVLNEIFNETKELKGD